MKNLFIIVRKYMGMALLLIFALIFLNIGFFIWYGVHYEKLYESHYPVKYYAQSLQKLKQHYTLTEEALNRLKESDNQFAMELNEKGEIIWSWHLPDKLHRVYSLSDIASMSRWYLDDYPVRTWQNEHGIFILGKPKHSTWKLTVEYPVTVIEDFSQIIVLFCAVNLAGILLVFCFTGWRLFVSLKPVAKGIEKLAVQEQISLPEKDITADLCRKINQTSQILEKQKIYLNRRDAARTNWISGVSHDIRTPLSMIMGYANLMKQDDSLSEEHRTKLAFIEHQSQQIKELIEDLNLTSKLEYEMQPLRPEPYKIGSILREVVSEYYNNNLPECFSIDLFISEEAEKNTLQGDTALLKRAFRNLIGNSIRHNPKGCTITVAVRMQPDFCQITFADTGSGIPKEIIRLLSDKNSRPFPSDKKKISSEPHILGLLLVRQIIESHGGVLHFIPENETVNKIEILLPDIPCG